MHRFYSPAENISQDKIFISDKIQTHHIKDVLRLKPKDEVVVFDDKGNEYTAFVEKLSPQRVIIRIKDKIDVRSHLGKIKVTVACAIPKGSRMDEIIDKLTQLGAEKIIPLETERVIIKLDKHKKLLRHKRWERIAQSSSLQSQRNTLPVVESIKNIKELFTQSGNYDLKLMSTLIGTRQSLKDVLDANKAKNILVLIGPEGDFSPDEINLAKKAGFTTLSLGDSVLRVETAAVAVASFIRLYADS